MEQTKDRDCTGKGERLPKRFRGGTYEQCRVLKEKEEEQGRKRERGEEDGRGDGGG